MADELKKVWIEAGQPEPLKPLVGRRVYRAWLLPENKTLVLRLEGGKILMAEWVEPDTANARTAVMIKIGDELAGVDWGFLDEEAAQTEYLKAIRGRKLVGIDADVLVFEGAVGVRFLPEGVRWVKAAN
jgi:hypothetical protein